MSSVVSASKPFRIGMLGAGTVGGGVYELLMGKQPAAASNIVISKICVRSLDKVRDFQIHTDRTVLTTDYSDLLKDDIDCVVEVAGGCDLAKDVIITALKQGKTVITANKAVLFEYMAEVADAADSNKAPLGYEAAVCGGIPIINTLTTAYAGDRIQSVSGICNGTTNYMLSKMAVDTSVQYDDVLNEAKDLGYAEADPTADVEGHDVRAKIVILAKLAFGTSVTTEQVLCTGISSITSADFAFCAEQKSTIKLIGTAAVSDDNNNLCVYVSATVVPLTNMLAGIQGCGNCVSVTSHNLGACCYTGPGAGRYPTANSIVADIYQAAAGNLPTTAFPVPLSCKDVTMEVVSDYASAFYIRVPCNNTTASDVVVSQLTALAKEHGVTIVATMQKQVDETSLQVAVTTDKCQRSAVEKFSQAAQQQDFVGGAPLFMPIMTE